jgi:hypothetical protein
MPLNNSLFNETTSSDSDADSNSTFEIIFTIDSDSEPELNFNYNQLTIDSDSDSESDMISNLIHIEPTPPKQEIIKCPRKWLNVSEIPLNLIENFKNIEHYFICCEHYINSKKNYFETTSNKQFSLIFKAVNDRYKETYPEEYKEVNKNVITQYRHKFLMERHSQLI